VLRGGVVYKKFKFCNGNFGYPALPDSSYFRWNWFSDLVGLLSTPTNAIVFLNASSVLQKGALTWDDSGKVLSFSRRHYRARFTQGSGNMTIEPGNNAGTLTLFRVQVAA